MSKQKRKKETYNMSKLGTIKNKIILIGVGLLIIAIGIVVILKFSNSEDTWICTKDGWVKHGNPKTEIPKDECVIPASTS